MKKNCWMTFDTVLGVMTGFGTGARDEKCLGETETILYRDTLDEIAAEPGAQYVEGMSKAHSDLFQAKGENRQQAFIQKETAARLYLSRNIPPPHRARTGPEGAATIDPVMEAALVVEYEATFELLGGEVTPTGLAEMIVNRSNESIQKEAARRVRILTSERSLGQPRPEIPNE